MDREDIISAIDEAFNRRRGTITDEQHRLDHEFVYEMRQRRMKWEKFWSTVRKTAIATITVTLIGGLITGLAWAGKTLWNEFLHLIHIIK